ncbi:MAG: galactonate dehydratase [Acidobacteria bacterium]|nr:galactonate dehydratase [Bryobacteraceae bacterium CoA2 C42]MCA2966448.1 galactonate dehydratase [Acidobacteriaceae bacterium]
MRRRGFLGLAGAAPALGGKLVDSCGCGMMAQAAAGPRPEGAEAFARVGSKLRITNVKVFGVSLTPDSDRPYVFVKIETNQGLIGWGEGTLEGKAAAVMACVEDFKELLIGADPMQVEHHWQSMYVHSFYRAGPVIGSAISGIDQALWDIRGKALNMPVYKLLGGPVDPRGVRGYYHLRARNKADLPRLREEARKQGITCFKSGIPGYYEWIETRQKIAAAVQAMADLREGLGPDIDIGIDFHAKTSPSVASILVKEVEPLNLLFVEEPCPPENVKAMQRIARRSTTPIATGERLVAHYGCREVIELGVADIIQTDINHVGGITALWKVGAMAGISGISMAPHACEGPIGGLATVHVDAATPNFLVQEICSGVEVGLNEKVWAEWMGFPVMRMVNGRFPLPEKPGLGFDLTEEALKKYPFGGTKPMARVFHEDGSVAEW